MAIIITFAAQVLVKVLKMKLKPTLNEGEIRKNILFSSRFFLIIKCQILRIFKIYFGCQLFIRYNLDFDFLLKKITFAHLLWKRLLIL